MTSPVSIDRRLPVREAAVSHPPDSAVIPLSAALRAYLDARAITTAQLAAEWGVPRRTLEGWLAGRTPTHPGLVRAAIGATRGASR